MSHLSGVLQFPNDLRVRRKFPRGSVQTLGRAGRQIAILVVALLLVGFAFRQVNLGETLALIASIGPLCLVAVVPSVLALSVETWAWQQTFAAFTQRPPLLPLLRIRMVTESFCNALPAGPVWAEALKPHLLRRHCDMALPTSLTGIAARKYLLIFSQGLYLMLGFVLGHGAIAHAFEAIGAPPAFAVSALLAGVVLIGCAELLALLLGGGTAAQSMLKWLGGIPVRRWQAVFSRLADKMVQTDGCAMRFFRLPLPQRALLALQYLGGWLLEAGETWLLLMLVGAHLTFGEALAVETVVVLVRHVLFLLPAGLGAQELGYALFLGVLGVSGEQSAAFVVLKRGKELLWIVCGYALFAGDKASSTQLVLAPAVGAQLRV